MRFIIDKQGISKNGLTVNEENSVRSVVLSAGFLVEAEDRGEGAHLREVG